MVFLPYLLKAAPIVTGLLSSLEDKTKNKSAQQGSFENMLQSALTTDSANSTSACSGGAGIKADEIKTAANAVLESIKKKIATPDSYSMIPGIVNLPNMASTGPEVIKDRKMAAAANEFNSAVATTPVKPVIESSQQSAQINIPGDNKSIVISSVPGNASTSSGGWERYRTEAVAMNKKLGGLMVGLRIPIG